mmetsp:Transcript_76449/g.135468  ORF Transcript_76449/g.135468 Transcript_76449/m.135468 type:complete len:511 (+) Transcript_76449:48-1580(+)
MLTSAVSLITCTILGYALQLDYTKRALQAPADMMHTTATKYAVSAETLQQACDAIRADAEAKSQKVMDLWGRHDEIDGTKLAMLFQSTYSYSADTFKIFAEDSTVFVGTGDIEQMWLRDSSVQLATYVELAAKLEANSAIRHVLESAMARQRRFILDDPYGSAFFDSHGSESSQGPNKKECPPSPSCPSCYCSACSPICGKYTYQRSFELDSLLFPILLHHFYWKQTGSTVHLDAELAQVLKTSLELMRTEQSHASKSKYFLQPLNATFLQDVGLVWSYALPSDDPVGAYYNIPENIMAAAVLKKAAEMAAGPLKAPELASQLRALSHEIDAAVKKHGIVKNNAGQEMFAFNVDGAGGHVEMDDANLPNLLWLPYFDGGHGYENDNVYKMTRQFVLSAENPNFFGNGSVRGLGSQHHSFGLTRSGYSCAGQCIWHLGLVMQGFTADSWTEKVKVMTEILSTDGDRGLLHEGFDPERPHMYNRDGFGWANSLFSQWVGQDWMALPANRQFD